jgi:hypothetical protein
MPIRNKRSNHGKLGISRKKRASDNSFDMGAGSAGPESPNITRTPDSFSRLTPIMAPRKERLSLRHAESGPLPRRSAPSVVKFFVLNPLEIISATAMNEPSPSPVLARSGTRTRTVKIRRANPKSVKTRSPQKSKSPFELRRILWSRRNLTTGAQIPTNSKVGRCGSRIR